MMKKEKEIKQILIALSPIMTQTFPPVISGDGEGYSAPRNDSVPIIGRLKLNLPKEPWVYAFKVIGFNSEKKLTSSLEGILP